MHFNRFGRGFLARPLAVLVCASAFGATLAASSVARPNVLVLTVDTLRADHLSGYGYERPTSPNIDRLMAAGLRFNEARTVEPLTAPALVSMLTSLYPHEHGATRNGLRMRPGQDSLPLRLAASGYRTAAIVGNWTLREKLSGLDEHFETYETVLTRKRWFGVLRSEADAQDLTESALAWLTDHRARHADQPFFLWVHYTDPHAPYRNRKEFVEPLGLPSGDLSPADRYDTEVAFADAAIGDLLERADLDPASTIIVFSADHGESLGDHDYWGHGRHLYDATLRVPLAIVWSGRIRPGVIDAPAVLIDLPPTILALVQQPAPETFHGYDWAPTLVAGAPPPPDRVTFYEAHKGVVISKHDSDTARRAGLLEVGLIDARRKEILRVGNNRRWAFQLDTDPRELNDVHDAGQAPNLSLEGWMQVVYRGLNTFDDMPPTELDADSIEQLRSLGYVD